MNHRPRAGRDFFAPAFLLLVSLIWGSQNILTTGLVPTFQWSNLLQLNYWLKPLTFASSEAQPKAGLVNGGGINDIYCLTEINSYCWAVGNGGVILHTTNEGRDWQSQISNTDKDLTDVYFTTPQQGWTVSDGGVNLYTLNGGGTWLPQPPDTGNVQANDYFTNHHKEWSVGQDGTIRHTANDGKVLELQVNLLQVHLKKVFFTSSTQGWAVGLQDVILHTTNGGKTWEPASIPIIANEWLDDIYFISPEQGWASGAGTILYTSDGGKKWTTQFSDKKNRFTSIYFISPEQGWAVGSNGSILHTTDGHTWKAQASNVNGWLKKVYFASAKQGWILGDGGILHTANGGINWSPLAIDVTRRFSDIHFISSTQGWAIGTNGTILHTNDGGQKWGPQFQDPTISSLDDIYFISAKEGWAVGIHGVILHTNNGGQEWKRQDFTFNSEWLINTYFFSPLLGWAVGNKNTIYHTADGGKKWSLIFRPNQGFYEKYRNIKYGAYFQWPSPLVLLLFMISAIWLFLTLRTLSKNPSEYLPDERGGVADAPLQYADEDKLGYAPLARGIAKLIRNLDSKPPLAIAVSAPWGQGKSSVMNMLQDILKNDVSVVQFNAWHYRDDGQILAALIEHIRDQAVPDTLRLSNLLFRWNLLWRRLLAPSWRWWVVVFPVSFFTTWWLGEKSQLSWQNTFAQLHKQSSEFIKPFSELLASLPSGVASVIGVLLLLVFVPRLVTKLLNPLKSFTEESMTVVYSPMLDKLKADLQTTRKNWQEDAGIRFHFQRDFADICYALGRKKLVLLIDDLDRCDPKQIEQIINTFNFLFSNNNPCYVVIALDWDYVKAALNIAYKEMANALGSTNPDPQGEQKNSQQFAENYLRKIIQLKVELPEVDVIDVFSSEQNSDALPPTKIDIKNLVKRSCRCITSLTKSIPSLSPTLTLKNNIHNQYRRLKEYLQSDLTHPLNWLLWPFLFMGFLLKVMFWEPVYHRLYRHAESDARRLMNLVFVSTIAFFIGVLLLGLLVLMKSNSAEPAPTTEDSQTNTELVVPGNNPLTKEDPTKKPEEQNEAAPTIVLDPQKNRVETLMPLIVFLLTIPPMFWIFWFFRQERDSTSFRKALKDWKGQLSGLIKTPREWRRLENNLRFFIMLARSFDHENPWSKIGNFFSMLQQRLVAFSNNMPYQKPATLKLDEGIATRLVLADIYFNGNIFDILNKAVEQNDFSNALADEWLDKNGHKIDFQLTRFFERLMDNNDIAAHEQARRWVNLHAFKLQLPKLSEQ